MNRLIGVSGLAQSGKSTVAEYLQSEYGYARYRFADCLKTMLRVMGLTDTQIDGDEKEIPLELLCGRTPRYAMQSLGTEWGRQMIGPDLWVNSWANTVKNFLQDDPDSLLYDRVVVEDIRFPNELEKVREMGGLILRIERPNIVQMKIHASETALDDVKWNEFGHVIVNGGTKEQLFEKIKLIIK